MHQYQHEEESIAFKPIFQAQVVFIPVESTKVRKLLISCDKCLLDVIFYVQKVGFFPYFADIVITPSAFLHDLHHFVRNIFRFDFVKSFLWLCRHEVEFCKGQGPIEEVVGLEGSITMVYHEIEAE